MTCPTNIAIRPAIAADIDMLVALHATGFEAGWDAISLSDFMDRDLVLVTGDPLAGFVIVRQTLDEAEIITLVIAPALRRTGLGQLLLEHVLNMLSHHQTLQIFLEVASDNQSAIGLYQQNGFTQIGLRKGYYARKGGEAVNALVLSKFLVTL